MQNIFIIFPKFIPYEILPRLSPATWAITIELFYYGLIFFGISKTFSYSLIWFGLSLGFVLYSFSIGHDASIRYASFFAASLPFSIGSLIYYKKNELYQFIKPFKLKWFVLALMLNMIVFSSLQEIAPYRTEIREVGRYINLILGALVLTSLIFYKPNEEWKYIDTKIGEYSYPIYLTHWTCGLISFSIFNSLDYQSKLLEFLLALILCMMVSFVTIKFVDEKINVVRLKVKARKIIF